MSADGRFVAVNSAFEADSPNFTGFVHDRRTGRWQQICPVVRLCWPLAISPDGRYTGYEFSPADSPPGSRPEPRLFDRITGRSRLLTNGPLPRTIHSPR
jgi:hypothetical protein